MLAVLLLHLGFSVSALVRLQAKLADIEALVGRVREARLRDLLRQGIAYLHEGMHEADQTTVQALFESGAIQVRP